MTLVNIDLRNQGYETSPGDRVVFYSLLVREGDFGTISTAPVEVELTDGKASVDLAPGPVGVQIIAGQVADTRVREGRVPMEGPTTLNVVLTLLPEYSDAVRASFLAAIRDAQDEALTRIDAEVAAAVDSEVGEFKTKAEQALTKSTAAESKSDTALSKSTTAESSAGNAVSRVTALEALGGLSPESPVDGQTANLIEQGETLTRAAVESAAIRVVHQSLPEYIVGPTGEYSTVADFFVDHPTGNAKIVLQAGYHFVESLPSDGSLKNFHMVGQGSSWGRKVRWPDTGTTVETSGPLISSEMGTENVTFSGFNLRHTEQTSTDDAIHLKYPRGLTIENVNIDGYGGTSIWLDGGIDCEVRNNYILAWDHARTVGQAGVRISAMEGDYTQRSATTIHTTRNYVGGSGNYGFWFDGAVQGMVSTSDIAEWCQLGFYFHRAPITAIMPYTESCVESLRSLDCNPLIVGNVRNELAQTWTTGATPVFDRRAARMANRWMDMGGGILMGAGGSTPYGDFEQGMSIRAGHWAPNGYFTAPAGSLYFMKGGTNGKTLWQKNTDGGDQGWLPVGNFTVSTAELTSPTAWLNANKYKGMTVWCHTLSVLVYASGNAPTDAWINVRTGEVEVTPA